MIDNRMEEMFTDSDDDESLPAGWEMKIAENGRVFYVDHGSKQTQWKHPKTNREKYLSADLPFGWQKGIDDNGRVIFLDLVNKRTTCIDPRIAYAADDKKKAKIKFDSDSTAMVILRGRDLRGKTALITGSNRGIGYETALALSLHGCEVILACRDALEGERAANKIRNKQSLPAPVHVVQCDLSSLSSVKACATKVLQNKWPIHIFICNAGIMSIPYTLTEDGIEQTFAVNHLGHYYLIDLLKDVLIQCAPSRVIIVSSESHRFPTLYDGPFSISDLPMKEDNYCSIVAYNQSKLCNLLFAFELNRRLSPHGVFCNAVHPGNFVHTRIQRHSIFCRLLYLALRPFSKSPAQGAATTIYCATSLEMENVGGYYFNNCCACHPSGLAINEDLAKKLWDLSDKLAYKKIDCYGHVLGLRCC